MTAWILSMSIAGNARDCLARWKKTGSIAWLTAGVIKLTPQDPERDAVAEVASRIVKDSPAYPTVTYHRIRLLAGAGKVDEARGALDAVLPGLRERLPASSLNLFLAQRMNLARDLEEFLRFAPRQMAGEDSGLTDPVPVEDNQRDMFFDEDSLKAFNEGLPLAMLQQAARSAFLPERLQHQLLAAAWVRAILLSNTAAAQTLARDMTQSFPEMKSDLQEYLSSRGAAASRFASVWLLLRYPGLSPVLKLEIPHRKGLSGIDNLRENWWCGFDFPGELDQLNYGRSRPHATQQQATPRTPDFPGFLTQQEKAEFEREWKRLMGVGPGPNFLGNEVLAWARRHPDDERVPEALHLVVKASRFGCNDAETWRYSRDAYQLLHTKYSDTPWAKATPYWFR
jgi:hypothetical protein